jgi:crossover junction endodeoxyribonuclease RuvC
MNNPLLRLRRPPTPEAPAPKTEKSEVRTAAVVTSLSIPGFRPMKSLSDTKAKAGRLFIGLDLSLTATGFVAISEAMEIVEMTTIKPKKLDGGERIDYIVKEVITDRILGRRHIWPDMVVCREEYAYAASSSSDAVLKELGGVIRYVLRSAGITLYDMPIASCKKFVTGKGNAPKDLMQKDVYKNLGVDTPDEHSADAVGVALTALALSNGSTVQGLRSYQKEVLHGIKDHPLAQTSG